MSSSTTRRPVHHPDALSRVFGEEAVIISAKENKVRMLNPTGSRIWGLSNGNHTLQEIALELTVEFDIDFNQASHSVDSFVNDMVQRGLLVWSAE